MSGVSMEEIKKLRDISGAGLADSREALEASGGDIDKAFDFLRKKGASKAQSRAHKEAKEGYIGSYVHNGRIGVLVEVNCETDFVARNEKFQEFVRNIAMHIAASNPFYLTSEDVPADVVAKEKEIYKEELLKEGKPENIIENILEGKMAKYYEQVCLMNQKYIKDDAKTIEELLQELVASIGEKTVIKRFTRYELGLE